MKLSMELKPMVRTALLIALAIGMQMLKLPQLITGSLINFVLYIATITIGILGGVIIGCLTPFVAFLVGIMGFPPLVPFIMLGNGLLVIIFGVLRKVNEVIALIVASLIKFAFLTCSVVILAKLLNIKVPPLVAQMMQLPQLVTALVGGTLALVVTKAIGAKLGSGLKV